MARRSICIYTRINRLNSRLKKKDMLPNFLIVGAQKCGTTTLHSVLDLHPKIAMSRVKELNFFSFQKNYQKGLSYYSEQFVGECEEVDIIGESSQGICATREFPRKF